MEKDIAIQVKNVSKRFRVPHRKSDSLRNVFVNLFAPNSYDEFDALNDISFDVKKGEFLGIIGRNGAGKSTLLKALAGIYKSDSGSIEIDGRISPFLELGIGFNPELSGRDNVYLNATVLGVSKEKIDEKFDEIVDFAEMGDFIDQQLKNYSSGMQARLAFSVSIHADREILLMDEVLAVGDTNFQQKCLKVFRGYKEQGKTVILVTHSMETVREYCDRALLFHHGELIGSGNVNEVCDEYLIKNYNLDNKNDGEGTLRNNLNEGIEVLNSKLLNDKNHEVCFFKTLDDFCFIANVKVKRNISNLGVGLEIRDGGKTICGAHNIYSSQPTHKISAKNGDIIEIKFFGKIIMGSGSYNLALTVVEQHTPDKFEYLYIKDSINNIIVTNHKNIWKSMSMGMCKIVKISK